MCIILGAVLLPTQRHRDQKRHCRLDTMLPKSLCLLYNPIRFETEQRLVDELIVMIFTSGRRYGSKN